MPTVSDPHTDSHAESAAVTTLHALVTALDTAVVEVVDVDDHAGVTVASAVLVDGDDLAAETDPPSPVPDVYLLVGVGETAASKWLEMVARRAPQRRPAAVMIKRPARSSLSAAAREAGVCLVVVHAKARWNHVFSLVERMLNRDRHRTRTDNADAGMLAMETDLFELAQLVAHNAGGLVSIEDARSKVLAYSASDESADELRTLSIMGREGPREYLRALRDWGVFDRIRETDDVVDVPAHEELHTRRRLVVGIRDNTTEQASGRLLGSIWVQQGHTPLSPEAADVLRGASAVAARMISRALNAPTTEGVLTQRLFGARGSGVDIPTVAGALGLAVGGPAAVIGFGIAAAQQGQAASLAEMANVIRLHASSFRRDAVVALIGERTYVLFPRYTSERSVTAWTRQMVDQFESKRTVHMRAALALPVADLSAVAGARLEVDRVLDATTSTDSGDRVTTLAESLTPVLLAEILDVIAGDEALHDPRLGTLDAYDDTHDGALRASAWAYLSAHGDVRAAADMVNVHPNTLRYRLRRVEEILGIDLGEHADRMLLEIQLAAREHRHGRTATH